MDQGAFEELLHILDRRELSSSSAEELLERKGYSRTAARAAVRKARRLGLVDDLRLARGIAERSDVGVLRVQDEFRRRKVAEDAAQRALREVDDEARCREALAAYVARRGPPQDQRDLQRLLSYLVRRGFTEESVRAVLPQARIHLPWEGA